ncbi:MAG: DUF5007 domain-containing protein [Breznakibacter sp.]
MSKKNQFAPFALAVSLMLSVSCERPDIGFLSDNIQTPEDVIRPPKGLFSTSTLPIIDGSTYPLTYEILEVRDGNGNVTNELFEKHNIRVWTKAFDPATDRNLTMEQLVAAKLKNSEEPTLLLNSRSGQFAFTPASFFLKNSDYVIDMKISNVRGSKEFKDFAKVSFKPFVPIEFPATTRFACQLAKPESPNSFQFIVDHQIGPDSDNARKVLDGTNPYLTIRKVSDQGAPGINVVMKIVDKNGKELCRKHDEISLWPSGASYLSSYHDNSIGTEDNDEGSIFHLPAPPFPQWGTYSGNSLYLMYYQIPKNAVDVDWNGIGQDPSKWANYRGYIRFGIKINEPGTWEVIHKAPYFIRKRA